MRADNLKSPGAYSNSQHLRIEAAKAISYAEIQADLIGAGNPSADVLRDFFLDCAEAANAVAATPTVITSV